MLEIIFIIIFSLYFIQLVLFTIGASKSFPKRAGHDLPSATVVVAARNEEKNIGECLKALDKLIYPKDKLEIIVINDHSTDKTDEIINDFIKDKPNFKKIIPSKQIGKVKGKANAIANALEIAKGEIILTTDADCVVSPTWAKTIASYYTKDVAMVCGYTNQKADTVFEGMQDVDFIYLLAVASGAMNLGKPLSAIGNNMSYRKDVYFEVGGYEAIPFSVTEDFKLLMAIHNLKKYKIIYPTDADALVTSAPCPDAKTLYWQKKRWGVGGLDSDLAGFTAMATAWLTHLGILLAPFLVPQVAVYLIGFKFISDYFFLYGVYRKLNLKLSIKYFLVFEIYFIFYVLVLPILLIFTKKVNWKGRKY